MTIQGDLIKTEEAIAGLRVELGVLLEDSERLEGTKAARRAEELHERNGRLKALLDERDELQVRVKTERLQREALKASHRPVGRQVEPEFDDVLLPREADLWRGPRQAEPSWGNAVVKASREQSGLRGIKSLLPSGTATVAVPVGGPVEDPRRANFLAELMPRVEAPGGHLSYLRQTVRTNNASVVAESAVKPTSVYTLERIDDQTDVVAHLSESVPRSFIDDDSRIRQFVEAELRLGLNLALDAKIVADLLAAPGILTEGALGVDMLFTTRRAITRLQEREVEPSAFVFHPRDWEQIEREAAAEFASNPGIPAPTDTMRRRLWGVPVTVSNAVAENTGLVGDFRGSAALYATDGVRIDWSEGHYDSGTSAIDFERNLIRFRAEGRWALAVTRPFAFCEISVAGTGS